MKAWAVLIAAVLLAFLLGWWVKPSPPVDDSDALRYRAQRDSLRLAFDAHIARSVLHEHRADSIQALLDSARAVRPTVDELIDDALHELDGASVERLRSVLLKRPGR